MLIKQDEKEVVAEDKLHVTYQKDNQSPEEKKEFSMGLNSFKNIPERVEVGIGLTMSPMQYESIRIDYWCQVHHEQGDEGRLNAFTKAKDQCMKLLYDDVLELHKAGVIQDHFLLPPQQKTNPTVLQAEEDEEELKRLAIEKEEQKRLKKEQKAKEKEEKEKLKAEKANKKTKKKTDEPITSVTTVSEGDPIVIEAPQDFSGERFAFKKLKLRSLTPVLDEELGVWTPPFVPEETCTGPKK